MLPNNFSLYTMKQTLKNECLFLINKLEYK